MEDVAGLLETLQLTEVERKGIQVGGGRGGSGDAAKNPKAVMKVLTDRVIRADTVEAALGQIWCPRGGVECKDLGSNHFLIIFSQVSGKKRALDDGPWMLSRDLVVVIEFDEGKIVEDMEFVEIPIWIRVLKMPLGMMNKWYGEAIGDQIGKFMEVEAEEDGSAVGECLRVKVRLDIRKPLVRGVTLLSEKGGGEKKWCPIEYEYLPDFCYRCGIIGHTERLCMQEVGEGGVQFSKSLRFIPKKRSLDSHENKGRGSSSMLPWRVGGRGGNTSGGGSIGGGSEEKRSGSDSLTWRKQPEEKSSEEVTSPLKKKDQSAPTDKVKKALFQSVEMNEREEVEKGAAVLSDDNSGKEKVGKAKDKSIQMHSIMQGGGESGLNDPKKQSGKNIRKEQGKGGQ